MYRRGSYLVLLVDLLHAPFAFGLCDDLAGVLNDDLVRIEHSHRAYTVPTVNGVEHLHTVIVAVAFCTSLELGEGTVRAELGS